MITNQQADVLRHTSNNGRYATDEEFVIQMGRYGLLFDHGPQRLADGMHYLTMRRCSREFRAWRDYLEAACDRVSFSYFHKNIWPNHEYR